MSSGAAQPHFNGAAVKQVIFSYPKSVKEQKNLIEKFEALSVETKKLEAIYKKKIDDLEELQKSVLQKAFSGGLKAIKELAAICFFNKSIIFEIFYCHIYSTTDYRCLSSQ